MVRKQKRISSEHLHRGSIRIWLFNLMLFVWLLMIDRTEAFTSPIIHMSFATPTAKSGRKRTSGGGGGGPSKFASSSSSFGGRRSNKNNKSKTKNPNNAPPISPSAKKRKPKNRQGVNQQQQQQQQKRRHRKNNNDDNGNTNNSNAKKPVPSSSPPKSIGEAVQQAQTVQELLEVASQFWLPTDLDLPSHLKTQSIHHERRQRWSAQLLTKLGNLCLQQYSSSSTSASAGAGDVVLEKVWDDERFARAVLATALPFQPTAAATTEQQQQNDNKKDLRTLREGIVALHTLAGPLQNGSHDHQYQQHQQEEDENEFTNHNNLQHHQQHVLLQEDVVHGIQLLLERAEANANNEYLLLPEAMEIRWAARGILRKFGSVVVVARNNLSNRDDDDDDDDEDSNSDVQTYLASAFPKLEERAKALPFDIIPMGIDFASLQQQQVQQDTDDDNNISIGGGNQMDIMTSLQESIPFQFDTIITRNGATVTERRGTAWVAEDGIGALAYSGKLMPPSPMPPLVRTLMGQVETIINAPTTSSQHGGGFFDCALCNYYPDGDSACKFHTDPEHGKMWERLNCVVSVGNSRRFAFRPIPGETIWGEWDSDNTSLDEEGSATTTIPAVIRLFPGDIVSMWGECNDLFHHAVYPENETQNSMEGVHNNDARRVSLVLKRAMVHGKGRRGHGLAGEGRRSRRQKM